MLENQSLCPAGQQAQQLNSSHLYLARWLGPAAQPAGVKSKPNDDPESESVAMTHIHSVTAIL